MRDILKEIYEQKITEEQAYSLKDQVVDKFHEGRFKTSIANELNMDKYEWTAKCHGIDFDIIAKWRYEGWPKICSKCKKPINYKDFGWLAKGNKLTHIKCFPGKSLTPSSFE